MANVFGSPQKLCNIPHKATVLGYHKADSKSEIVTTFTERSVSLITLEADDVRPLKDWSLTAALKPSCSAVIDKEGTITCAFQQTLRTWNVQTAVLDKAKAKSLPPNTSVWRVFPCPWGAVLVLAKDGTYMWANSPHQVEGKKQAGENVWCDMTTTSKGDVLVVRVFKQADSYKFTSLRFSPDGTLMQEKDTSISFSKDSPVSFAIMPVRKGAQIIVYASSSNLWRVELEHGTAEVLHSLPAKPRAYITAANAQHIVVAGLLQDSEEGIGIWDTQFNLLKAWMAYPETCSQANLVYLHESELFVSCDSAVYLVPVSVPASSLCSVLGRLPLQATATQIPSLAQAVQALSDSSQTSTYKEFKAAFNTMLSAVPKQKSLSPAIVALQYMRPVLQRCTEEEKFWPRDEIGQLIQRKWVPSDMYTGLMKCLVSHGEVSLLYQCLSTEQDIAEESLAGCLNAFMKSSDDELSKACDETPLPDEVPRSLDESVPLPQCPFSPAKMLFVNKVLVSSYNDVFLLDSLKKLELAETLELMKYLHYLLTATPASGDCTLIKGAPNLLKVVDWICLLVDSHFTQLVLSADAKELLVELHSIVESQIPFYGQLITLESILNTLAEKCTPPVPAGGTYNILTIHI